MRVVDKRYDWRRGKCFALSGGARMIVYWRRHLAGAECRIGFENNCHNANGKMAKNNAERVAELCHILRHSRLREE